MAQIIFSGGQRHASHALMPPFGRSFSNTEVAAVANYVTARFGAKPSSITAEEVAKLREQESK